MVFSELLNKYLEQFHASSSDLVRESGLSASTVSRYRIGEREPACGSIPLQALADGLFSLSEKSGNSLTREDIQEALTRALGEGTPISYEAYLEHVRLLFRMLEVKGSSLARALSYDPSYISKILSGKRRLSDPGRFSAELSAYIARTYTSDGDRALLARLLSCSQEEISTDSLLAEHLKEWLGTSTPSPKEDPVAQFLRKLDDFNLEDYIESIHFNEIRLPSAPFQLPGTRVYRGLSEMMESELDFIRTTVLSRSSSDCILYSDMPLEEMAEDPEFPRKWMFGMAMLLKKGLHLHIIHDVNRPFPEMMLGLEGNIPMYMTGQISPYYLRSSQSGVFSHLLKVSGAAALEGTAIAGHQGEGRYVLYKNREDVAECRRRAEALLALAEPLMEIYREDRKEEFLARRQKALKDESRYTVSSSLPLFTVTEGWLKEFLTKSGASEAELQEILSFREEQEKEIRLLKKGRKIRIRIPLYSRETLQEKPPVLSVPELFLHREFPYEEASYLEHLEMTKRFAHEQENLELIFHSSPDFRNLSYTVVGDQEVLLSKDRYPTIHFLIRHSRLVQAFRNYVPPILEE